MHIYHFSYNRKLDNFRLTITITSIYKWDLRQIDIKTAYLNSNQDEKIHT